MAEWKRAPIPDDEAQRIAELVSCGVLDTAPEAAFDDIAQLARVICGTPIALVSLVDVNRQWFKARLGIAADETARDVSFCGHALTEPEALIVEDTAKDDRFRENPFVTGDPYVAFYAGVPIRLGKGSAVGTLCVIDTVPRQLSAPQLSALVALAHRVEIELGLRKDVDAAKRVSQDFMTKPPAPPRMSGRVEESPLSKGSVLANRYRVEDLLGSGGMGRVYTAFDLQEKRRVAVKMLFSVAADKSGFERFVREAQALKRVGSEHVAQFLDAGNLEDGRPFYVMEHLDGYDLSKRSRGDDMAIAEAANIVRLAADAVAKAHEVGVVHRDLKPQNVFLVPSTDDGPPKVKLLDFGIAKLGEQTIRPPQPDHMMALTQATDVLGSPLYMAPEQMLSSYEVGPAADIWSLGILLYELIGNGHPFEGETMTQICASIFTNKRVPLSDRRPDVPPELEAIVDRCLAREPRDRWPTARALAEALLPFSR